MEKPILCLSRAENCEDCVRWEPIPFHESGGECILGPMMPLLHEVRIEDDVQVEETRVPRLLPGWVSDSDIPLINTQSGSHPGIAPFSQEAL